jgi:hypothetical protein
MYTPADTDWVREEHKREVHQLTEGRWWTEGVIIAPAYRPSVQPGGWLRRFVALVSGQRSNRVRIPSETEQPNVKQAQSSSS